MKKCLQYLADRISTNIWPGNLIKIISSYAKLLVGISFGLWLYGCLHEDFKNLTPPDNATFRVHGSISGLLIGDTLALQNNGGDTLNLIQTNPGALYFNFPTPLPINSVYNVTVSKQPVDKFCLTVNGGFGTVYNSHVYDVMIDCVSGPFSVGGFLFGLPPGSSVTLKYDFIDPVSGAGSFTGSIAGNAASWHAFSTQPFLKPNTTYSVLLASASANVVCSAIENNSGIIRFGNVDNLSFHCGKCGNGIIEAPETCDDANVVSGDGCSFTCQAELCGNGVLNTGENCDDANMVSGDGCSATCQTEGRYINPTSFEDATLQGWSADGLWHISQVRASTPGAYSMHYANALTNTYDTPGTANSGSLTSPITPVLSSKAQMTFEYFKFGKCLQGVSCVGFDKFYVEISVDKGLTWTFVEHLPEEHFSSVSHTTQLGAWAGSTIKIRFVFDTVNALQNNREGAYVDNIYIVP